LVTIPSLHGAIVEKSNVHFEAANVCSGGAAGSKAANQKA
jgi:hypothetical protein